MKRAFRPSEKGATAVEFAIVASLFLSLVFGIIEFSILMFDQHVLTNASREGARAGIVMRIPRVSDTEIQDKIRAYAEEHMVSFDTSSALDFGPWFENPEDPADPTTWISPDQASRVGSLFGTELKVTVKYPFDFLVLSAFGLGPVTLEAETRMRME